MDRFCLPQIVASVASFAIYPLLGSEMKSMILLAGILMLIGAISVFAIKEIDGVNANVAD